MPYFPDEDGDGWGEATADAVLTCEPDLENNLTARNYRDCDDGDPDITAVVGSLCPSGLVAAEGEVEAHGVLFTPNEYVYLFGSSTPVERYSQATTACQYWGGESSDGGFLGTLATFDTRAEVEAVQAAIEEDVLTGSGVYAGFVGLHWDGELFEEDAWSWVDDSDDGLMSIIGFCDGIPDLASFTDQMNPDDPEHAPHFNDEISKIRVAMVLQESGTWCLGTPEDAIPADIRQALEDGTADLSDPFVADVARYTAQDAHFVCERPEPNPDDYEYISPDAGGDSSGS